MFNFLRSLFSLSNNDVKYKKAGFLVLDVDQESSRLRLESRGKSDGVRELPASDSVSLGVVENEIAKRGRDCLQANSSFYESEYQAYVKRLESLTPEGMLENARFQAKPHFDAISALPNKFLGQLTALHQRVSETEKSLKLFRHDNDLEDLEPDYPDSKILQFSILIIILLVESLLNASLLAKGSELGLLGGWIEAIIISLINTAALGALLCFGFKNGLSVKPARKFGGYFFIVLTLCGAAIFNLFVAHYRNALGSEKPEFATAMAWDQFWASPFDLGDVKSLMLLIVGFAVVVIAAIDWLKMDDKYPGYGARARAYHAALREFGHLKEWLIHDKLESAKDEASNILAQQLTLASSAASSDAQLCRSIATLNNRYETSQADIQKAINFMLQRYREANKSSRQTPPPAHFDLEWRADVVVSPQPVPENRSMPNTQVYDEKLTPLQNQLSKLYDESLQSLNGFSV